MGMHTRLDFGRETLSNQTRAEKRRAKKQQEKDIALISPKIAVDERKVYTLSEEQLKDFLAIERKLALTEVRSAWGKTASKVFLAAMKISLHDNFGFGAKRLDELSTMIERQLDCVIEGVISVDELEETANRLNEKAVYKR